jgi:hypothetical protein
VELRKASYSVLSDNGLEEGQISLVPSTHADGSPSLGVCQVNLDLDARPELGGPHEISRLVLGNPNLRLDIAIVACSQEGEHWSNPPSHSAEPTRHR